MENGKQEIGILINELCNKRSRKQCNDIYTFWNNDLTYISDHYNESTVDEKLLLTLLQKSKYNNKLKYILPDILDLINSDSITDCVIDFCINYPRKYRETLIIQLAHKWLNPHQLEVLNLHLSTAEAFCKLLIIYISDTSFPPCCLSSLLTNNRSYIDDAKYCLANTLKNSITEIDKEKLAILKDLNLIVSCSDTNLSKKDI